MVFRKFVQIGRVALVNHGPDLGKLCTIIDVIDESRVLVDGPCAVTGVHRQAIPLKWVVLTRHTITIPHSCCSQKLVRAFKKAKVAQKFNRSRWASKLRMRKAKETLTDFDRFKIMINRHRVTRSAAILGKQLLHHYHAKREKAHLAKITKERAKVQKLTAELGAKKAEERKKKEEANPKKVKEPRKKTPPPQRKTPLTPAMMKKRAEAKQKKLAAARLKAKADAKIIAKGGKVEPTKKSLHRKMHRKQRKVQLPTWAETKRRAPKKEAPKKEGEDKDKKKEEEKKPADKATKTDKAEKKPAEKKPAEKKKPVEKKPAEKKKPTEKKPAEKKPAAKKEAAKKPQ